VTEKSEDKPKPPELPTLIVIEQEIESPTRTIEETPLHDMKELLVGMSKIEMEALLENGTPPARFP